MQLQDNATTWNRPKTIKRYLHPPMSERIFTLWAEGKIIMGKNEKGVDFAGYHKRMMSGLWLVHGETDEQFDFTSVKNLLPSDGIPVHGLRFDTNGLQTELESFCNNGLKPTCFIKVTVTNNCTSKSREKMAFLVRYGNERHMVYGAPDSYSHYAPDVQVWKDAPSTFIKNRIQTDMTLTVHDEFTFVNADGELPVEWDQETGAIRWTAELRPGESKTQYFSFGVAEALPFDYDEEKGHMIAFWQRELSRINKLPAKLLADKENLAVVKNLTVQMLQCFCRPVDMTVPLSRQGGLQRLIWQWEAIPMLQALGEIGEFGDYIEPVIAAYFDEMQAPNGEILSIGADWANLTASALCSFARYCKQNSRRFWYRYRDHAMAAFDWMQRTRASTVEADGVYAGLFPPRRANDLKEIFQAWGSTDVMNVEGLEALTETAELFKDPRAAEIRNEFESYRNRILELFAKTAERDAGKPTLRVPLCPSGDDEKLIQNFFFTNHYGKFLRCGCIDLKEADRVEAGMKEIGKCHEGLYGHMSYSNGNTHIWYVSIPDYDWFVVKMRQGKTDEARKIYESQIKWAMTDEYYMLERYADNDEYFTPWSPNASASGRTVLMLLNLINDSDQRIH